MIRDAKILGVGLLLSLTIAGLMPLTAAAPPQLSLAPSALSISVVPSKLPADNNTYPAIVVSVVDNHGQPTAALSNIDISLTSSQESVGTVSPILKIPVGQTYAIANFTTTHTAGLTTVTASTTGLVSSSTGVSTVVAVGYPTQLVMDAVPSSVPARPSNTGYVILELEDDVGLPAKAITDTSISLYSSNANVANVTEATTVMKQGQYLKEVNYTSGFVPGSATITASATGFGSGSATINVLGSPALALKLFAQPSLMPACTSNVTSCTGRLVVALTDLNGNPTRTTHNIQVQIRSSDLAIATTSPTATIEAGNISATATFTVVAKSVGLIPDTVELIASSPGLQSDFAIVTVQNPYPVSPSVCAVAPQTTCSLQIFAGPDPVVADHRSYSSVVVSLQQTPPGDPLGPAINMTGPTEITLTSALTGIGNFTKISFEIPEGQNWAAVTFTSTYQVGQTTLTASSQNFLPAQTSLATYGPVPSKVVVTPISPTLPADGASHPALQLALEDAFGDPAIAPFNVPVSLTSSHSDLIKVSPVVIPGGQTFAVVNVTSGILAGMANVTALESSFSSGYASSSAVLTTVIPAPSALSVFSPNQGEILQTTNTKLPLVAIQLEDSGLNPARARAPVNVTIVSSNSTVIPKVMTASFDVGQDYAPLVIDPAVPGRTTLTFSAPGLSSTSMLVDFLQFPLSEAISGGPASIFTNQTSVISVNIQLDGSPAEGASVLWTASSGGVIVAPHPATTSTSTTTTTSSATTSTGTATKTTTKAAAPASPTGNDTTPASGISTVIFKPSKPGPATISADITLPGIASKTLNMTVTVTAPPPPHIVKPKPTLEQQLTTFPLVLAPIGGAGGAVMMVLLLKRRGSHGSDEEDFDDSIT